MKPIAIFRHSPTEGPGYFSIFLDEKQIPWRLICVDEGEAIPSDPTQFSGLSFMGGPMSVNDPLSWIPLAVDLIKSAVENDIPVIGHCLGGQLMSKAMGGQVTVNNCKEIGWHPIHRTDNDIALEWLGEHKELSVFHWHGDTFSLPLGATHIAASAHCENQMFVRGKHIGMQCHIEMMRELVKCWCDTGAEEIAESTGPAVQSAKHILSHLDTRLVALNQLAFRVYTRWIQGLKAE